MIYFFLCWMKIYQPDCLSKFKCIIYVQYLRLYVQCIRIVLDCIVTVGQTTDESLTHRCSLWSWYEDSGGACTSQQQRQSADDKSKGWLLFSGFIHVLLITNWPDRDKCNVTNLCIFIIYQIWEPPHASSFRVEFWILRIFEDVFLFFMDFCIYW